MFELSAIRETRVFQDALEERKREGERDGKLKTVPLLLQFGMSVESIARELGLDLDAVREAAVKSQPGQSGKNGSGPEPS